MQDPIARSVKRLTIAIWVLAVVSVLNLCVSIVSVLFPPFIAQRITASLPKNPIPELSEKFEELRNFSELPIEKQIAGASVIVLATWKEENGKLKCIISEILKQKPGTVFHYKVGDEYTSGSRYPQERVSYGDGQVMLFVGSPARMQYAVTYSNDRIAGMGDMPLALLREMVQTVDKASQN